MGRPDQFDFPFMQRGESEPPPHTDAELPPEAFAGDEVPPPPSRAERQGWKERKQRRGMLSEALRYIASGGT